MLRSVLRKSGTELFSALARHPRENRWNSTLFGTILAETIHKELCADLCVSTVAVDPGRAKEWFGLESEVACIKQRIEQECEALRLAMDGFAVVTSHEAIMARYNRLADCQAELEKLVGPGAEKIVCELYARSLG